MERRESSKLTTMWACILGLSSPNQTHTFEYRPPIAWFPFGWKWNEERTTKRHIFYIRPLDYVLQICEVLLTQLSTQLEKPMWWFQTKENLLVDTEWGTHMSSKSKKEIGYNCWSRSRVQTLFFLYEIHVFLISVLRNTSNPMKPFLSFLNTCLFYVRS